jgi:hypothetical protein
MTILPNKMLNAPHRYRATHVQLGPAATVDQSNSESDEVNTLENAESADPLDSTQAVNNEANEYRGMSSFNPDASIANITDLVSGFVQQPG